MSLTSEHQAAAESAVRKAIKAGQADTITKKTLVKLVEKRLKLSEGYFDKQQKSALAEIAKQVLEAELGGGAGSPSRARQDTSKTQATHPGIEADDDAKPKISKGTNGKARAVVNSESDEDDFVDEKPRSAAKTRKEVISDYNSDEEDEKPAKKPVVKRDAGKAAQTTAKAPPGTAAAAGKKRKSDPQGFHSAEFINSEGDPISASQAGAVNSKQRKGKAKDSEDSEASSSEDAPPKKKAKTKAEGKAKGQAKPQRGKKAAEALSPDEEELKRLKSFVVACGERKQWTREFEKAGVDTLSAQIKYLRQMLKELGMSAGRLSLEAAKRIGAQRALEKEAAELGVGGGSGSGAGGGSGAEGRVRRAAAMRKPPPVKTYKFGSDDSSAEEPDDNDDDDDDDESESGSGSSSAEDAGKADGSDEDEDSEVGSHDKGRVASKKKSVSRKKVVDSGDESDSD